MRTDERITITLFDMEGRAVQVFLDGLAQSAGEHRVKLELEKGIAPGSYQIRITTASGASSSLKVVKE